MDPQEERISALEQALEESRSRVAELVGGHRASTEGSSGELGSSGGPSGDALSWRALYDGLPDPVLTVDAVGVVLACNRTGLDWLGEQRDGIIGRPLVDLFDETSRAELEQVAAAAWIWAAERRFTLNDGRVVGLNAVRIEGSREGAWHVTMHDLTTRAVLDEAADQRRRMDTLSDLAGAIARELNDPMSIVQGRLELLLELGVSNPDMVQRHLEIALEHARRISATLRNLRLVGRTAAPRTEPVGLSRAVDEALELVGPRGRDVVVDLRPDDLATSGEGAMYARVFANLLRRALDQASRQGRVELKARNDRGHVVVRISTRGRLRDPGELLSTAFSIDETLLASVGGRLRVEGGPGEVVFTLQLPPAPHRRVRARPVEDHLLLVGSETFRRNVEALLAREGFAITTAPDGERALEVLAQLSSPVDAVAAELLLDGMSGLGLAEALLTRHPELSGRIVVVSHARIDSAPPSIVPVAEPLRRRSLLEALGRRVR